MVEKVNFTTMPRDEALSWLRNAVEENAGLKAALQAHAKAQQTVSKAEQALNAAENAAKPHADKATTLLNEMGDGNPSALLNAIKLSDDFKEVIGFDASARGLGA
ncbi:MAG: hypothetical protein ACKVOE_03480 [Rickettsiales bacterium]